MKEGRDAVIEALNLARLGKIERACSILQQMRNRPDLEADAYYGLGLLELCRNKINDAEAYFSKATALDPSYADAYYQLAKIADSRGDSVTATLYLKSALAENPGHVMAAEALLEHGVALDAKAESALRHRRLANSEKRRWALKAV
jgi:tetratricopeptide (TPR) repeat protein